MVKASAENHHCAHEGDLTMLDGSRFRLFQRCAGASGRVIASLRLHCHAASAIRCYSVTCDKGTKPWPGHWVAVIRLGSDQPLDEELDTEDAIVFMPRITYHATDKAMH
jgi:hypothetical protein